MMTLAMATPAQPIAIFETVFGSLPRLACALRGPQRDHERRERKDHEKGLND